MSSTVTLSVERLSDTEAMLTASGTFAPTTPAQRGARAYLVAPFAQIADGLATLSDNTLSTQRSSTVTSADTFAGTFRANGQVVKVLRLVFNLNHVQGDTISGKVRLALPPGNSLSTAGSQGEIWYGSNNNADLLTRTGTWQIVSPVAKVTTSNVHTQSAKKDWYIDTFLQVMGAVNQQNRYRGEIRFNLSSLPSGNVAKATLYLSTTSTGPSGDVIVERLTSDPSVAGQLYSATVGTEKATTNIAAAGRYSWDVTAIVQQWRNQSAPNYGFRLRPNNDMNFPATTFNKDLYDATTNPAGPLLEVVVA